MLFIIGAGSKAGDVARSPGKGSCRTSFLVGNNFIRTNIFPLKHLFSHVKATLGTCLRRNSLRTFQCVVIVSFFSAMEQGSESLLCI